MADYRKINRYLGKNVNNTTVYQHREVMEKHLGRKLKSFECVHHIDCDRSNNKITNLKVVTRKTHGSEHTTIKNKECPVCNKIFRPVHAKTKHCSKKCSNFASRKTKWPSKEQLKKLVVNNPMVKIGEMFGVSDNAVRKWLKYYGLQ